MQGSAPEIRTSSLAPLGFVSSASTDLSVVVFQLEYIENLWQDGFFGSAAQGSKMKPNLSRFRLDRYNVEPLKLSACEAYFLLRQGRLRIELLDTDVEGCCISEEQCLRMFSSWYSSRTLNFRVLFSAYEFLRRSGWIVKQASALACHFVLYEDNPDQCHSEYAVIVSNSVIPVDSRNLTRTVRLATQSGKVSQLSTS
mmetsp:Transcript_675/g.1052  ORF Transcript_675/g.1052 Transcript_675/m.1052 type:complete len:198 (-) Transcript_675:1221-1814(-)